MTTLVDMDTDIAKLILKESKAKEESWKSIGVSAYLNRMPEHEKPNPPKTNKRFLKSVIRDVNDHNQFLLGTKPSLESSGRFHDCKSYRADKSIQPTRPGRRVEGQELERLILRSGFNRKGKHKPVNEGGADYDEQCPTSDRHEAQREYSSRYDKKSGSCRSNSENKTDSNKEKSRSKHHTTSLDPSRSTSQPAVQSSHSTSSKMDKYFSPTYDPRLDINLDDLTDQQTGLIHAGTYDDWESILHQLKTKRDEKARLRELKAQEKLERLERRQKRREVRRRRQQKQTSLCSGDDDEDMQGRPTRKRSKRHRSDSQDRDSPDKISSRQSKKKQSHRHRARSSSVSNSTDHDLYQATHVQRTARKELGLMDVEGYAKQGKVREWDLGKQNPT